MDTKFLEVKLQSIWSQMKYHYHNLVHRQILHKDRFSTKWEHFEPMSFMYNITVAKIVGSPTSDNCQQQQLQSTTTQSQGRGRPSGSFAWLTSASVGCPVVTSAEVLLDQGTSMGFTGLVPPAAVTVETTTTVAMRKSGRSGCLNNGIRAKIIDAIRERPILWARRKKECGQGQNRSSGAWKEVAAALGLSASLVQTRWSIIKQRYVDELQKERQNINQNHLPFYSNWEHFERMAFMRDILVRKVDDREQTRERIQEIVSEKQGDGSSQLRYVRSTTSASCLIGANHLICNGVSDACGDMSNANVERRRVKAEADLEWDPFEMIIHVHGTEAAN